MANKMVPVTDTVVEGYKRVESLIATIIPSETNLVGVRALPEKIFINNFLPYFSGKKDITPEDNPYAAWAEVAGTLTAEVAIINEHNQVLFMVPAIYNTEALGSLTDSKNKDVSIQALVNLSNLERGISPIAAEAGFKNNINEKIKKVNESSPKQVENEKRWNEIFARYGTAGKTQITTVKGSVSNLDPDEMVYD